MADIKCVCPHCSQHLEAPDELAGQTIECPSCKGSLLIPAPKPIKKSIRIKKKPLKQNQPNQTSNQSASSKSANGTPCPSCGERIAKGCKVCGHCMHVLRAENKNNAPLHPTTKPQPKAMNKTCPGCGVTLPVLACPGDTVPCDICGTPIEIPPETNGCGVGGCLLGLVIIGLFVFNATIISMDSCSHRKSTDKHPQASRPKRSVNSIVLTNAKAMVLEKLKAPSTVQWVSANVVESKHPHYIVLVTYDAQNSFGAMIRGSSLCCMTLENNNKRYVYNQEWGCSSCSSYLTDSELQVFKDINSWDSK